MRLAKPPDLQTRAWLASNRARLVGELTIAGLCEKCAGILVDDAAKLVTERTDEVTISICVPCLKRLCPPGEKNVFTVSSQMFEESQRSGAPLSDEEAFGLTCALLSGWRPGKEN